MLQLIQDGWIYGAIAAAGYLLGVWVSSVRANYWEGRTKRAYETIKAMQDEIGIARESLACFDNYFSAEPSNNFNNETTRSLHFDN